MFFALICAPATHFILVCLWYFSVRIGSPVSALLLLLAGGDRVRTKPSASSEHGAFPQWCSMLAN